MVLLLVGFVVAILLLGRFHPKSGAEILDWRPARPPEVEAQGEEDDLAQMLAGVNARRRARGRRELTEAGLTAEVQAERRALAERRDAAGLDDELRAVLDARNARRRRRGEPELTLDELRASLGGGPR
jgi:2,3-bisphosphoglycerate-independent phosphoglycerate mutase